MTFREGGHTFITLVPCSVCLQMVGRAGRPGFDTEGMAVIMTQKQVEVTVQASNNVAALPVFLLLAQMFVCFRLLAYSPACLCIFLLVSCSFMI